MLISIPPKRQPIQPLPAFNIGINFECLLNKSGHLCITDPLNYDGLRHTTRYDQSWVKHPDSGAPSLTTGSAPAHLAVLAAGLFLEGSNRISQA